MKCIHTDKHNMGSAIFGEVMCDSCLFAELNKYEKNALVYLLMNLTKEFGKTMLENDEEYWFITYQFGISSHSINKCIDVNPLKYISDHNMKVEKSDYMDKKVLTFSLKISKEQYEEFKDMFK